MATYRILKAQITKLEKQAADLLKKEVADVVAKIHGLMNDYGLTVADLGLRSKAGTASKTARKTKVAKPAGVPKYRDPVSGKTWTGHGKAPVWLVEGVKKGKSKDDFLIGKKAPVAKAAKVTNATKVAKPTKVTPAAKASKKPTVRKPATKKQTVAAKLPKATVRKAPAKKAEAKVPVAPAATDKA